MGCFSCQKARKRAGVIMYDTGSGLLSTCVVELYCGPPPLWAISPPSTTKQLYCYQASPSFVAADRCCTNSLIFLRPRLRRDLHALSRCSTRSAMESPAVPVPLDPREQPILEKLLRTRDALLLLKQDKSSYIKSRDVLPLYEEVIGEVETLNSIRKDRDGRLIYNRCEHRLGLCVI